VEKKLLHVPNAELTHAHKKTSGPNKGVHEALRSDGEVDSVVFDKSDDDTSFSLSSGIID
jgi:hypothetical protein